MIGDAMPEETFAAATIRWYEKNARDLPWRAPDVGAWAILVSEVMLQQTPVVRVLPAWRAWLDRWPTPAALAADTSAEAIRMWGRLGYPRRALRLWECAVAIVERHGGAVPTDLDALLALPGVGTYTARAVAAFAFGQRHPVVDTNVRRVVARAVAGEPDAGPATRPADLVATAALLPVEPAEAAKASAAFMELGALVCTAQAPDASTVHWSNAVPGGRPGVPYRWGRPVAPSGTPAPTGRYGACCWRCCARRPARWPGTGWTSSGRMRRSAPGHWPA